MIRVLAMIAGLTLVATACGGADPGSVANTTARATTATTSSGSTEPAETQAPDSQPADTQPADTLPVDTQPEEEAADQEETPIPTTRDGSATVTLENGDVFEFAVLCVLNPAEVGDTEFEFYIVSYDDPFNLDVSQFTPDSFNGAANISIYDSTSFGTTWEANTFLGGEVELALDGTTVTGSGVFLKGEDAEGPGVRGDLVANC